MHLFIPLLASFIFVVSLVCVKRVANPRPGKTGLEPVTVLFFSYQAIEEKVSGLFTARLRSINLRNCLALNVMTRKTRSTMP